VGRKRKEGCKAMPTWRRANRTRNDSSEENEMEKRWRGSVWMGMFGWDEYPLMEVEAVGVTVGWWPPQGTAGWDERCPSHRLGIVSQVLRRLFGSSRQRTNRFLGFVASVWLLSTNKSVNETNLWGKMTPGTRNRQPTTSNTYRQKHI
jgi:hypothetical protein